MEQNNESISEGKTVENVRTNAIEKPKELGIGPNGSLASQIMIIAIAILLSSIVVSGVVIYSGNNINTELKTINSRLTGIEGQVNTLAGSEQGQAAQPTVQARANTVSISLAGKIPRGDPNAGITIVEYSDFQCPFCERVEPTLDKILQDYAGKVKLYYKHFPLTQGHQYAQKAAEASECAADQGKFWEYHDKLFENQGALDTNSLKRYATDLGLDAAKFNACLDNGDKTNQVNTELQEGISNGVQGTPAFLINGQLLSGAQPYANFKQIIDSELIKIGG